MLIMISSCMQLRELPLVSHFLISNDPSKPSYQPYRAWQAYLHVGDTLFNLSIRGCPGGSWRFDPTF